MRDVIFERAFPLDAASLRAFSLSLPLSLSHHASLSRDEAARGGVLLGSRGLLLLRGVFPSCARGPLPWLHGRFARGPPTQGVAVAVGVLLTPIGKVPEGGRERERERKSKMMINRDIFK